MPRSPHNNCSSNKLSWNDLAGPSNIEELREHLQNLTRSENATQKGSKLFFILVVRRKFFQLLNRSLLVTRQDLIQQQLHLEIHACLLLLKLLTIVQEATKISASKPNESFEPERKKLNILRV